MCILLISFCTYEKFFFFEFPKIKILCNGFSNTCKSAKRRILERVLHLFQFAICHRRNSGCQIVFFLEVGFSL